MKVVTSKNAIVVTIAQKITITLTHGSCFKIKRGKTQGNILKDQNKSQETSTLTVKVIT